MRKFALACLVALFTAVTLAGCVTPVDTQPRIAAVEQDLERLQREAAAQSASDPAFKVMPGIFISDGRRAPVPRNAKLPELFTKTLALRASEQTLPELASQLSAQVGLAVTIAPELLGQGSPSQPGALGSATTERRAWSVNFSGTLLNFLDALAAQFGAYWDYESGAIALFRTRTRVFSLSATPGRLSFTDRITNESEVGGSDTGGASLGGGATAQGQSAAGGHQVVEVQSASDVWAEVLEDVKAQLSPVGKADANPAAGVLTVSDTPPVLDRIQKYVDAVNARLSRQIALTVRLFALTLSTEDALGFSLDAVFTNAGGLRTAMSGASPFTRPTGIATANAVVLPAATGGYSKFIDTSIVVEALRSAGRIAQVTETSVITRNNRTAPIQQTNTRTYIAQTSTVVAPDAGSSTSLIPGTVVSGFSGLVTPHVLDDGRVLLQYGINLVVLNDIAQLTSNDQTIGGPDYTKRAFDAEMVLRPGETIIVVPYKEEINRDQRSTGLLSWYDGESHQRVVVVMAITMNVLPN